VYSSFEVESFRCFERLRLHGVGRVNLIAGRNNVGKTALLEALYLHATRGEPYALLRIIRERAGVEPRTELAEDHLFWEPLFWRLDTSRQIRANAQEVTRKQPLPAAELPLPVQVDSTWDSQLEVREVTDPQEVEEQSAEIRRAGSSMARRRLESLRAGGLLKLVYRAGTAPTRESYLTGQRDVIPWSPERSAENAPVSLVPASLGGPAADAGRFRTIAIEKRTTELVDALRVIEPRLADLQVLPLGRGYALYGDIGLPRLVSLSDMGEGMNRLASLTLALSTAARGVVLVDEIENGLHHTVHHDVWRVIGESARRLDVQVFATTHSLECIQAAHRAFSEGDEYDLRVHRLQRVRDEVHDFVYDQHTLEAALETDLEVR